MSKPSRSRILVTGAKGFLGRHTVSELKQTFPDRTVIAVGSEAADLTTLDGAKRLLAETRPDVIVHLAAYSGGIGANRTWPADFYFRNVMMVSTVYEAAARQGVKKIVYTMGGCSYPATAVSPIGEDQMWAGFPQPDSAAYSTAKKMGIIAAQAYKTQYGIESTVLVPGNLYGEYDNFRTGESHVIPALIRRFHEAKVQGAKSVVCWGRGIAERDFVYAGDVAALIPRFVDHDSEPGPLNLSQGGTTTIRQLSDMIRELVGCPAQIAWDADKPEGQLFKVFGVAKMHAAGLDCPTPLREGLTRTITWFQRNYDTVGDGLRL